MCHIFLSRMQLTAKILKSLPCMRCCISCTEELFMPVPFKPVFPDLVGWQGYHQWAPSLQNFRLRSSIQDCAIMDQDHSPETRWFLQGSSVVAKYPIFAFFWEAQVSCPLLSQGFWTKYSECDWRSPQYWNVFVSAFTLSVPLFRIL